MILKKKFQPSVYLGGVHGEGIMHCGGMGLAKKKVSNIKLNEI